MSRSARFVLAFGLGLATSAASQQPRVALLVGLAPQEEPNGARRAMVQIQDLLTNPRWVQALDVQAFPIRLSFHLEIWRSRDGWIDDFQRSTDWTTVIQKEPLEEQFLVTRIVRAGSEYFRFATLDELNRWVRAPNVVDALPQGTGTFYYTITVRITALTDQEMEELERFLAGQPEVTPGPERSSIGRWWTRFLMRMAGLPREELEARSPKFTVRRR